MLPCGVQLVQQLGDPWHQALGVCVTHPPTAAATATAAAAASAIAVGKGLVALYPLEQPEGGTNVTCGPQIPPFYCAHLFAVGVSCVCSPLALRVQFLNWGFYDLLLQCGVFFNHPPGSI